MHLPASTATEILNSGTDALIVVDRGGTIVFANRRASAVFGYQAGELLGQTIETVLPVELQKQHAQPRLHYGNTLHSRSLVSALAIKARCKDGRVIDTEIASSRIESEDGVFVQNVIREIGSTDTPEAFFRHLLDRAPDAMVIVDNQGRIAIVNARTEEIFGYQRELLIGKRIEMLIPERFRRRHCRHRESYVRNTRIREMGAGMTLAGLRSDGSEFPVEISLSPIHTSTGLFVSSVIRDVTERHRMQQALVAARQAAERANKANSAFLAAASHDLRQPVQALSLLAGALRRTVKDRLALEMIESQQDSLDAMTNLLNSLLDISRLDAGAVAPEFENFSAERLISRLSPEISRQAKHKGLRFEAQTCDVVVRSDPNLLDEIIQNFVSNAIRYTDTGSVRLHCAAREGRLWISLSDTGIGIAPDQLENIFREFHQINAAHTKREGFGLGLAIARRLADLLGHEIKVESTPGEGSCFTVCVPIAIPNDADTVRLTDSTSAPTAVMPGLVMLIEDDSKVARAWSLLLRGEGYRVILAASANQAREALDGLQETPQLIISDFHLLDQSNGVEAIAAVREYLDFCVPAIILTGDTSKVVAETEQLINCAVVSKPVSAERLLQLAKAAIASASHLPSRAILPPP